MTRFRPQSPAAGPASASNDVFGSLAHFDVAHTTGKKAHGCSSLPYK